MWLPGAIRSGPRQAVLQLAAVAEKAETLSSHAWEVPLLSAGPTARIWGSYAGAASPRAGARADRGDRRMVRGIGEPLSARAPLVAGVAAGCHHDDAGLPRLLDGVRERVDLVRLSRVRAVREVGDADVHPVVVAVLHNPVDGGDHLAHIDAAVGDTDLERDDARIGGDAAIATCLAVVTGDEPRHERPVPVRVEVLQARVLRLE